MNTGRVAVALAGVGVVMFGASFALGRATGGEEEPTASSGAERVELPDSSAKVPALTSVGAIPELRPAPRPEGGTTTGTTGGTSSTTGSTTGTTSGTTTGSTTGTSTGGTSTTGTSTSGTSTTGPSSTTTTTGG